MSAATVIGIDLGTTFSAVGVLGGDGRPRVLHNSDGQNITPSVVLFDSSGAVVGQQAKLQRAAYPDDVVEFVKRQMGNPSWRFFDSEGTEHTAESISAIILKRLVGDAALVLGQPVTQAVITVPAYFDETQRTATRQAGEMAGLEVLSVVNEPTAAAISFGVEQTYAGTVVVYDLGGGTFDVTVLRISGDHFDIIATDGDRNLGGFDFDNAIIRWAAEEFTRRTGIVLDSSADQAQLRERAEQAKHRLSTATEAPIFVSAGGRHEKLVLTRDQFEDLTEPLLARTELLIEDVLDAAGLAPGSIDKVLLVGGSTRMPMVARMLARALEREPDHSVHPDEAVARGAAILGDLRRGAAAPVPEPPITVSDVISHGLGVVTLDSGTGRLVNTVLLPANSKIPGQRVETFYTVADQQTELQVQVTEGDEIDLRYAKVLGESLLTIPPYPQGAPVGVTLSADIDGIVHISVLDQTSGRGLGEFEIDRQFNLDRSDVERMRRALAELEVQ